MGPRGMPRWSATIRASTIPRSTPITRPYSPRLLVNEATVSAALAPGANDTAVSWWSAISVVNMLAFGARGDLGKIGPSSGKGVNLLVHFATYLDDAVEIGVVVDVTFRMDNHYAPHRSKLLLRRTNTA